MTARSDAEVATTDPVGERARSAAVRRAIEAVPDPELPPVTIGMLGMVNALRVEDGCVHVDLLPTFAGCPATEMIERDVSAAATAVEGIDEVVVRFRYDPPWTADRIDEVGRERLREFGIAPPGGPTGAPTPDGRRTLPLALGTDHASVSADVPASGTVDVGAMDRRPCPYCGSLETVQESSFGPTPCRDLRFCSGCGQPFEAFKHLGPEPAPTR